MLKLEIRQAPKYATTHRTHSSGDKLQRELEMADFGRSHHPDQAVEGQKTLVTSEHYHNLSNRAVPGHICSIPNRTPLRYL
jgi:hypothetical protein